MRRTFTPAARAALRDQKISRRAVLKSAGALVVGFAVADLLETVGMSPSSVSAQINGRETSGDLDSWIAVGADGRVTAFTGKCEIGQGLFTAQTQLIAEELCVPLTSVVLITCDTGVTPDQGVTSGAQSHPANFNHQNLAQAGATAREALVRMASQRLGVAAERLVVSEGVVHSLDEPTKRVSYGELIGGRRFAVPLDGRAKRRHPKEWTVLGTSVRRVDLAAMVTGELEYVQHVRMPGLLHGSVVRPTTVNATLVSVDESSIRDVPGVVRVVVKKNFVGIVAEKAWQARQAASKLRVLWKKGAALPKQQDFYDYLKKQPSRDSYLVDSGDVESKLAGAAQVVRATYYYPYQMHGSIGTSCAVADVKRDQATIWSSTQGVYMLRDSAAILLGLPAEKIRVIYKRGSGCYGINGADTASFDAALLSQAIQQPVRVQLLRKDEMVWENFGVPFVIDQRVGLDSTGTIIVWDHESWSASRGGRPGYNAPGNVVTGFLAGHEPASVEPQGAPRLPSRPFDNGGNAAPSYVRGCVEGTCGGTGRVSSERVLSHIIASPLFTGPLRAPNRLQNTFAHESFIDEIAAKLKVDPVEYRLRHLQDARLRDVIFAASKSAGWEPRSSPREAAPASGGGAVMTGRGMSCVLYEGDNGYAAMVAEVDVNATTGDVSVTRLVIAMDVGPISNPDGLKSQAAGGALQGMSRALMEEVTWNDEYVTAVDWRTYRTLPLSVAMPKIEVVLISRPDEAACGAGETTITIVAAAIANAVFDATGVRLREVPFTPARVKAALLQKRSV